VYRLLTKSSAISLPVRGSPASTEDARVAVAVAAGAALVETMVVPLAKPNDRHFDLAASR